jgi:virginiamycin B lyase
VATTFGGLSYNCTPWNLTAGPDGNLWITEGLSNQVARMTPSGAVTQYNVSLNGGPFDITRGPDDRLWFTAGAGSVIGRITTSGYMLEWTVPTADAEPKGIATGPGGNVWFTERKANKVGFVRLDSVPVPQSTAIGALAVAGLSGAVLMGAQLRRRRRTLAPGA